METNRRTFLGIMAAAATVSAGCSGGATGNKPYSGQQLKIFNWSDYIDPDLIDQFQEQTGARVVYDNYSSDSELETRLLTGGGDYDLVVPSDRSMRVLLAKQALSKLDRQRLPNLKHVEPRFLDQRFDPGNQYSVPYFWGTLAVGLRADHVDRKSMERFEPLFDPKNAGRITMLDDAEHAVAVALIEAGKPLNSTEIRDLAIAKDLLMQQRKLIQAYTSDAYKEKLIAGQAWASLGWNGDLKQAADEEASIRVLIPTGGTLIWLDSLALCKGGKNQGLAHEFINFLLDPVLAARNAEYVHYATPNQAALALLPSEVRDDEAIYPSKSLLDRCHWLDDRGAEIVKVEQVWREVRQS
jgi:spermidine/putrescine transport system substrate-binding protein